MVRKELYYINEQEKNSIRFSKDFTHVRGFSIVSSIEYMTKICDSVKDNEKLLFKILGQLSAKDRIRLNRFLASVGLLRMQDKIKPNRNIQKFRNLKRQKYKNNMR